MATAGQLHFHTGKIYCGEDEVGELKDVTLDFSNASKKYKGTKKFTQFKIVTEQNITGKASSGHIDGALLAKVIGATEVTPGTPFTLAEGSGTIVTDKKAKISNAEVSKATTFVLVLEATDVNDKAFGVKLFAVTFEKFSFGLKTEDFGDSSFDFEAQADALGEVGEVYFE